MKDNSEKLFSQRLNLYGQFLSLYIIIFVIFVVLREFITQKPISTIIYEPLVMLMLVVIFATSVALLALTIKKRQIIFGEDYIIIRNRFFAKKILFKTIKSIKISRSPSKVVNNDAMLVRIKVLNKKKIYLIRTASFTDDKELLNLFINLRKQIGKT